MKLSFSFKFIGLIQTRLFVVLFQLLKVRYIVARNHLEGHVIYASVLCGIFEQDLLVEVITAWICEVNGRLCKIGYGSLYIHDKSVAHFAVSVKTEGLVV